MGTGNSSLSTWNPSALSHALIHIRHWYVKDASNRVHLFTLFHDITMVRIIYGGERQFSDPRTSLSLLDQAFQLEKETPSGCRVVIVGRKVGGHFGNWIYTCRSSGHEITECKLPLPAKRIFLNVTVPRAKVEAGSMRQDGTIDKNDMDNVSVTYEVRSKITIEMSDGSERTCEARRVDRFRNFHRMMELVECSYKGTSLHDNMPHFPARGPAWGVTTVGQMNEYAETRRIGLEQFLKQLTTLPRAKCNPSLLQFLGLDNCSLLMAPGGYRQSRENGMGIGSSSDLVVESLPPQPPPNMSHAPGPQSDFQDL